MNPQFPVMVLRRCAREDSEAELSRTRNAFKALWRTKVERSIFFQTTAHFPKKERLVEPLFVSQAELQTLSVLIQNNVPQNLIKGFFLAGKFSIRSSDTRRSKVTSNPKR